ncbi:hypothetical protein Microterr_15240 [Microbacterium terricola]|uniref:Uncharacterized protein n=1 Tax=Microbacterium terricola TaxID=344163 RepID=A0ABM8DZ37_9MICO|nr:hypothetical protein Microterr_15240 [Microbacterium terricola]
MSGLFRGEVEEGGEVPGDRGRAEERRRRCDGRARGRGTRHMSAGTAPKGRVLLRADQTAVGTRAPRRWVTGATPPVGMSIGVKPVAVVSIIGDLLSHYEREH